MQGTGWYQPFQNYIIEKRYLQFYSGEMLLLLSAHGNAIDCALVKDIYKAKITVKRYL